ncbi:ATP-dependent zinc metalloprotease FtsH [Treponema zuelzerae]|uniref:ATP-dependent zinc metalloprotease FtsH n=1 Tax=Teretinema zuelzerae TaxID=156 RepID=A0AAE3EHV5_9SPIR|nr:ATP-dependent zinc metalloprotease FtsH [Teretinema zuelzerae]MCD1653903.1 ATP-dependent zinc metalloprotease FtsH [Teretinema zuelzerae]HPO01989.1 ATP-dependent zinc metalloprotease FtsH [Treponemataceae bacterium]
MSNENNSGNNDRKPDPNDPFNFFKLSPDSGSSDPKKKSPFSKIPVWAILLAVFALLVAVNYALLSRSDSLIPFSEFRQRVVSGEITRVEIGSTYFTGYTGSAENAGDTGSGGLNLLSQNASSREKGYRTVGLLTEEFVALMNANQVVYAVHAKENNMLLDFIFQWILPFAIFFLMWRFLMKRMGGGMGGLGGSIFSAGQARSAAVEEGKVSTRFADVAGVDEAKEELVEVVDFLKFPKKYTDIGGKIPRGVLLVGPPGTGKTLLARAVAGEAGVPFFRISGSDFVEMFVGVGASRVRDLFKQAREKAPCIVFIDELDAIGKSRINSMSSNDEREQTLNQLLVEMDGFDGSTGLILLAATNRPDVLDPALLRPGRFDRQVVVDRPDVKGREQILKIHSKNVKLSKEVQLETVARTTSGFSGADLANVINEAALLAVRAGRKVVEMVDLNEAVEKAVAGLQKKSRVIKESERKIVAYHETGHALTAAFTEGSDKVHKVSIIPRGIAALGYTLQMPDEDSYLKTEKEMIGEVDVLLGGRAAEVVAFDGVSTGASNDLMRATEIVRRMITDYGMSDRFRNVALTQHGAGYGAADPKLVRDYSEQTQQYIDEEIARIINIRFEAVKARLAEKKQLLDYISGRLLEKEIMEGAEFASIIAAESSLPKSDAGGPAAV